MQINAKTAIQPAAHLFAIGHDGNAAAFWEGTAAKGLLSHRTFLKSQSRVCPDSGAALYAFLTVKMLTTDDDLKYHKTASLVGKHA